MAGTGSPSGKPPFLQPASSLSSSGTRRFSVKPDSEHADQHAFRAGQCDFSCMLNGNPEAGNHRNPGNTDSWIRCTDESGYIFGNGQDEIIHFGSIQANGYFNEGNPQGKRWLTLTRCGGGKRWKKRGAGDSCCDADGSVTARILVRERFLFRPSHQRQPGRCFP